jgi:HlyD family secretion protein
LWHSRHVTVDANQSATPGGIDNRHMELRAFKMPGALVLAALAACGVVWWVAARAAVAVGTPIAEGAIEMRVDGPGTVQARFPVTLAALVSARVVALGADHGDLVKRGQLLAVLDDRESAIRRNAAVAARDLAERNAAAAKATLAKAEADVELARHRERRDQDLHRSGFISQSAYDASRLGLEAAAAARDNAAAVLGARGAEARMAAQDSLQAEVAWSHTRILSPGNALVIQRAVEVGSAVAPGTTMFRLVDPASLWVAARIDEAQVGGLAEGMPARIRLRSGGEYTGRVARISRLSDAATRELEVDVAFEAPPARFAIEQEAEVSILAGERKGPIVPIAALVRRRGVEGVMVVRAGQPVFQPLTIAARDARHAVVASGLLKVDRLAPWTSR